MTGPRRRFAETAPNLPADRIGGRERIKIDLHCHSSFSAETLKWLPGLVFYPPLSPVEIYRLAKQRGMSFVTITDHDTIDGCLDLMERLDAPADFMVGEEITTRFPEDDTIVHVNVFDIDEEQHREIQRRRQDIYDLVAYLRAIDKLHVLNHMTWNEQHRPLKSWQIDAMLDLFRVFEGINGTRSIHHNAFTWCATRGRNKVLVGGSDSHTNRVGTTYSLTEGLTREEVLGNIKAGRVEAAGAFGLEKKLKEDVVMILKKEMDERLAGSGSPLGRLAFRLLLQVGRSALPLVFRSYRNRQEALVRRAHQALCP